MNRGLLVEFSTPRELAVGIRALRAKGYAELEAFTPYPVEEVEDALALRRSRLPVVVFFMGLLGLGLAVLIQWWTNAVDYPLRVGGFPLASWPAYVPIAFETTVLVASFTAFVGCLARSGLPRLCHPVFEAATFGRAAIDRFFLAIDAEDSHYHPLETRRAVDALGALTVYGFGGER